MEERFSNWTKWTDRNNLENILYPGIYALAYTDKNISNRPFSFRKEIVYFGMTNSRGGLKSRLQQFENTIAGKTGHGGAMRVKHAHNQHSALVQKLYVAISVTDCDVRKMTPADLLKMGDVAKQEYVCLATYKKKFKELPQFNDKDRSKKK